ncbi:HAD family hydrolase [Methanobrevibacter sp.]
MKRLAIFDFDGTIMDSVKDVVIHLNEALSMHGFPTLTSDEYVKYLGGNIDEIVSLVLEDESSPQNIKMVKDTYLKIYYPSQKVNTIPFAKSQEILRKLQEKGVLIAINSNRFNDSIQTFTDKFFSNINFFSIMGHDFDYPSKPDPYAVNEIIRKADVNLEDVIYIGDSNTDIQTAKNAGIDCVVVRWGYGNEDDWENDYILECITDFDEIIKYF